MNANDTRGYSAQMLAAKRDHAAVVNMIRVRASCPAGAYCRYDCDGEEDNGGIEVRFRMKVRVNMTVLRAYVITTIKG